MNEPWTELFANLPAYLGGHILLSMAALAAALVISLPLGVAASRRPRLAESILAVSGVIQTVPSLALLGLMMLLLNGTIGFWPAFLTLVLYSVLPILANTVIGIRGVDPLLTEAARGLGMNERQMLLRVELPLASPVILGGVRTATVMIVGTATLATQVGSESLGNYIFAGLATLNHSAVMFGCVAAALLAVGLDQLVHLLEVAAQRRSKALAYLALAGLLLVSAAGLVEPIKRRLAAADNRVVIANAGWSEQYILSHALSHHLEDAGFRPDRRDGMAYGLQLLALKHNDVDCMVTYTGDVWTMLMKRRDFMDPLTTHNEVTRFLQHDFGGVVCLGKLGFDNAYALAMTSAHASKHKVTSIADLVHHAKTRGRPIRIGGDISVFQKKEWSSLKEKYLLRDHEVQPIAMDQTLTYAAARDDQVDAIIAYTSDGRVKAYGLQLLTDPERVFPPYDAILVVSPAAAIRPGLQAALRPLLGRIDQATMQEANGRVDIDHHSPKSAAAWLRDAIKNAAPR